MIGKIWDSDTTNFRNRAQRLSSAPPAARIRATATWAIATHELHDMNYITPRCQVEEIKAEHRAYFKNQKEALEAGYDYCAYFFGKGTSKR